MAESEQNPIVSFRSSVFGDNVVVELFEDRLQYGKPQPKLSTGQRVALGVLTTGHSVIFTGLNKKGSDLTVIPIEMIDSVEVAGRGVKEKAKHLSNAGVFPGRGNWKSSMLLIGVAGQALEIPVESDEADRIRTLISELSAARRLKVQSAESTSTTSAGVEAGRNVVSIGDELKKLHELHQIGALTEDEFNSQKARLLGNI